MIHPITEKLFLNATKTVDVSQAIALSAEENTVSLSVTLVAWDATSIDLDVEIEVSNDLENWTADSTYSQNFTSAPFSTIVPVYAVTATLRGRYVRVRYTNNGGDALLINCVLILYRI